MVERGENAEDEAGVEPLKATSYDLWGRPSALAGF